MHDLCALVAKMLMLLLGTQERLTSQRTQLEGTIAELQTALRAKNTAEDSDHYRLTQQVGGTVPSHVMV